MCARDEKRVRKDSVEYDRLGSLVVLVLVLPLVLSGVVRGVCLLARRGMTMRVLLGRSVGLAGTDEVVNDAILMYNQGMIYENAFVFTALS